MAPGILRSGGQVLVIGRVPTTNQVRNPTGRTGLQGLYQGPQNPQVRFDVMRAHARRNLRLLGYGRVN